VLTNDIDYSHKGDGEEGASTETNYTAIGCDGFNGHPFMGNFDGTTTTLFSTMTAPSWPSRKPQPAHR
jgi:hypothetical protein